MIAVVPYVPGMLRPFDRSYDPMLCDVSGNDYRYWNLIRALYNMRTDFLIVEQDIDLTMEQYLSLEKCPEDWCVYGYKRNGIDTVALGVFRLRERVMMEHPGLLRHLDRVKWTSCDGEIYGRLKAIGLAPHRHYPNVRHEPTAERMLMFTSW